MAYIDYYKILGVDKVLLRMISKRLFVSWPGNITLI